MLWHKAIGAGGVGGGGEPWDISSASYVQFFSVSGQETSPTGIHFSPDGTNMYVCGTTGDDVNQYSLSTPWDISTASYVRRFSVAAQDSSPQAVFFKPDGTQMFVLGGSGGDVNTYSLSTAWNISTASYVRNFVMPAFDEAPTSLFFSNDGTRMYVSGQNADIIEQYDVSPAWLISSGHATLVRTQSLNAAVAITFKPDGTKMYVLLSSESIQEYNLSTAWNISTLSLLQSYSASAQDFTMEDIFFREDGRKMYTIGRSNDRVYEYNVSA